MKQFSLLVIPFKDCTETSLRKKCHLLFNFIFIGQFKKKARVIMLLNSISVQILPISLFLFVLFHCPITLNVHSYPEWQHMQGGCLACSRLQERIQAVVALRCTDLYYARGSQGVLPMRVGGATSQLYLPSLTPLYVAGCGRL